MIEILNKEKCCGCGACVQVCPKQCISMVKDCEGFLYPNVNKKGCIGCGLCQKVCPFLNPYDKKNPVQTLAAINKDEQIRMDSSSGGIFTLLAEQIINEGGVVFGARFDKEWQVVIDYTETLEGLAIFRGSKYVQARTEDAFLKCASFLKSGRKVMFSGSPCEITGLKHFLQNDYDNLLTVDFVCHGVPSAKVWVKYLHEVSVNSKIFDNIVNDLAGSWKSHNFEISYDKDKQKLTMYSWHKQNDYMIAFLQNMILRPSCYACQAKECRSHSDITIGDFWGINEVRPKMNDDKGTGLILIHTIRGRKYLPYDKTYFEEVSFEEGYRNNPVIYRSVKPHSMRSVFFKYVDKSPSVILLINLCLYKSYKDKLKALIKFILLFSNKILKKKTSSKLKSVNFRCKEKGWSKYQMKLVYKNENRNSNSTFAK